MKRVVIVGGGITGLTMALHLQDRGGEVPGGLEVVVLEASTTPGGNIRTDRVDGFVIERGPNGFLDNAPATMALVRRLGLESRIQKADDSAAKRFLYRAGTLHHLPTGPLGFLKSPVLSLWGRLRVFAEPFARAKPEKKDETIYEFASRRIGHEAASVLIDAMVSGVFAGDINRLSLVSSFPKMAAMEAEYGSLVKAMLARMKERRAARREVEARRRRGEEAGELVRPGGPAGPGGTLTSFQDGLDVLPAALADKLGSSLRTGVEVTSLEGPRPRGAQPVGSADGAQWAVGSSGGEVFGADAVVLAVPSPRAQDLLEGVDRSLAAAVGGIGSAGLAVVALAFREGELGGTPDGFGFLVPRGTGPRILGCLWDSSIFPGRAPPGKVLLRVMIGGAHDPKAVVEEEQALVSQCLGDLRTTMGVEALPVFSRVYRWPLGIGQYHVGHEERLSRIHGILTGHPGLFLAGSSFHGISMNACIEKASHHAGEVLALLGEVSET